MKLYKADLEQTVAAGATTSAAPETIATPAPATVPAPAAAPIDDAKAKAAEETRFQDLLKRASSPGPEIGHGWGTSVKMKGGGHGFGQ